MAKFEGVNIQTGEVVELDFEAWNSVLRPTKDWSEKMDPKPAVPIEPYMPPQVQISDMMTAGARLAEARKARFDDPEGTAEDVPLDPTRGPGVDLVDVARAATSLGARLDAQASAAASAAAAAAEAKAKAEFDEAVKKAAQELLAAKGGT